MNLLESLSLGENTESSKLPSALSSESTLSTCDILTRLQEMFPNHQLSYLEELAQLTSGDLEYAAEIAAEAMEHLEAISSSPGNGKTSSNASESSGNESKNVKFSPVCDPERETASMVNEYASQNRLPESFELLSLATKAPLIQLSPHFLKFVYNKYSSELGLPKLTIG